MSEVWRFDAIGTRWQIETPQPLSGALRTRVEEMMDAFDRTWSRFRSDSLVSALAATGGSAPAPADAAPMLALYEELSHATAGAVNPLVAASLSALGYDPAYRLTPTGVTVPAPSAWTAAVSIADGRLRAAPGALLDVGALGKGRLVDIVGETVTSETGASATVDAGGDIRVWSSTERIGLEHPYDSTRVVGVWEVTDAALCASATNRRAWGEGLHHVLDARTGEPIDSVAATWAVSDSAMRADAASTALFFDGGAELAARWGVAWVRMFTDGRVNSSPGCPAELFTRRRSVNT
ncbi:FAD:protein FMN transferase [Microbacterium aurantiacum]|uniref:FAD:protein FMN transferase n=1 Tax=Microbacterium aurantiacum TaxID=162393 RepID=UPI001F232F3C|nr:FAD:protein FMN transferase [Microbacterium aurantiacum]